MDNTSRFLWACWHAAELAGRRGLYDNCREDCCFLLSIPHTPYYIQVMALQLLATLPGISNQTRLAYLEDAVARLERMKEIDNDEGVQTLERTTLARSDEIKVILQNELQQPQDDPIDDDDDDDDDGDENDETSGKAEQGLAPEDKMDTSSNNGDAMDVDNNGASEHGGIEGRDSTTGESQNGSDMESAGDIEGAGRGRDDKESEGSDHGRATLPTPAPSSPFDGLD